MTPTAISTLMARVTLALAVAALAALAVLALTACRDDPAAISTTDDPQVAELAAQRGGWEQQRPRAYRFTVEAQCFCLVDVTRPRTLTIDGDEVVTEEPPPGDDPAGADRITTVEDLFDRAGQAIEEADEVEIEYDADYHFPTTIAVDVVTEAIDDEVTYVVTHFEALDG